jgi:DNA (cytosine-5)-methyltransferase 1
VIPGASPAGTAIDFTLPAQRIGSRDKPLASATIERIRRGLHKLGAEPFALRLLHGDNFKPATLPLFTLSQRQDVAMVFPVAGNTFERTPGNRARDANVSPMDTLHGTLDKGMVLPAIAELQNHGGLKPMTDALHTLRAGGFHHGVVVANYGTSGTSKDGWARAADEQPFGSITATDSHSLVVPYDRTGNAVDADSKSCPTLTQVERMALVGSNMANNGLESAHLHPAGTATTGNKLYLAVPPKDVLGVEHDWTDEEINDCRFRMFDLAEIARTMVMHQHADGEQYVVVGNKRERMAQYGNAVTPPVMRLLVGRALDAMDEAGSGRVAA